MMQALRPAVVSDRGTMGGTRKLPLLRRFERKLLTKPLWLLQRHWPRPIRRSVFSFPPIEVFPAAEVKLVILTTPQGALNAGWAAYSLLVGLTMRVAVEFVLDGPIERETRELLGGTFRGCSLSSTVKWVEQIAPLSPAIHRLSVSHPMGRKLATVLALQEHSTILFSDDDVLCFKPMTEVAEAASTSTLSGLYLQESSGRLQLEPRVMEAAQSLGLPVAEAINVGLLLIGRRTLEVEVAEAILQKAGVIESWFPDTVILAVLMALAGARPLCPETYLVSAQGQFYFEPRVDYERLTVRHFTTPVRHLMYAEGMQFLKRKWFRAQVDTSQGARG